MDVQANAAARAEADIPYQVLYIRIQRLIASLTKRQTRCWAEPRPSVDILQKKQQEGFVVERKNLPPMMQEREKDWSRKPVFAQAKLR